MGYKDCVVACELLWLGESYKGMEWIDCKKIQVFKQLIHLSIIITYLSCRGGVGESQLPQR